ncbi:MAG: alpha/beta hydrolase, partial [Acidimicrobiia bacterium]
MTEGQLDVRFAWQGLGLAGTLHLPDGPGPHPAIVMLQGSGPSDRDAEGYFLPIRDAFLEAGVAAYSFDKPGCGESTGRWQDYALEGRADQASAARELILARPEVTPGLVGFWGQSQGGWLVQMLAARHQELPFAISNSGPSIGVEAQDLYAIEHTMRSDGCAETEIEDALDFVRAGHTAAAAGLDYRTVLSELIEPASGESWSRYVPIEDEADWQLVSRFVNEAYDPLEVIPRIGCPFLAVYGARDVLVPAWESARQVGDALRQAPTVDSTVVVFPRGDHRIEDVDGDG